MYLGYSLILTIVFLASLPWLAIDALRSQKYTTGLRQRLGKLPAITFDGRPLIWLHCVSIGETEAARPLVRALLDEFPSHRVVISTTSVTGQRIARNAFGRDVAAIFYFPIDWAWNIRRVLRALQPAAVLIMETELWPHLLRECHRSAIPVALANGRISSTSFRRYRLIRPFISSVLNDLTIALMQSEADAKRLNQLGFPAEQIRITGNLKFDSAATDSNNELTRSLRERFALDGKVPLLVAASTHDPEEKLIVEAFKKLKFAARLVIAPRKPERFDSVAHLLRTSQLIWVRRTEAASKRDNHCDVILLDTIGELRAVYQLSDVAFVGGSIAQHGGHNVIEPAAAGACVITGPHTENFDTIMKVFLDDNALIQMRIASADAIAEQLAGIFRTLVTDEDLRRQFAGRATLVCMKNRGATTRSIRELVNVIPQALRHTDAVGKQRPLS